MFSIKSLQIFSHVYSRDNKENTANSQASVLPLLIGNCSIIFCLLFVGIIYFTTGALKGCHSISSVIKEFGLNMLVLVPALKVVLSRHL